MKNVFKGFYSPTANEFQALWENAIFVFDTNVLLNLYRYQTSTRDSLLAVMERLSGRVWIPYHVGLEFQRSRLKVIAAQHKRYSEVQSIIKSSIVNLQKELDGLQLKKRHSYINPDIFLQEVEKTKDKFIEELERLEKNSVNVNSYDEIRDRIDNLFSGKIGSCPSSQTEIEKLFTEAEVRYKNSIPPGFEDSKKGDKNPEGFAYGGITYKHKYGDFIVWKQLITHVSSESIKDVIFVTDDAKSDWWSFVDSNGRKNVGVRPELTDEIIRDAGVERFYAYSTEGFLKYANIQLGTDVTDEAIEEVRALSILRNQSVSENIRFLNPDFLALNAVENWLESSFFDLEDYSGGFLDFISHQNNLKYGIHVTLSRMPDSILMALVYSLDRAARILAEEEFDEVILVIAVFDEKYVEKLKRTVVRRVASTEGNIRVVIGVVDADDESHVYDFIPYDEVKVANDF